MIKFIINSIKAYIETSKLQTQLSLLFPKLKKSEQIKIIIPKTYAKSISILAMYGIDSDQLLKILSNLKQHKDGSK